MCMESEGLAICSDLTEGQLKDKLLKNVKGGYHRKVPKQSVSQRAAYGAAVRVPMLTPVHHQNCLQ